MTDEEEQWEEGEGEVLAIAILPRMAESINSQGKMKLKFHVDPNMLVVTLTHIQKAMSISLEMNPDIGVKMMVDMVARSMSQLMHEKRQSEPAS